jgi:hypothetical protein
MEENTLVIDCLIIYVENKLFGSVKKPHELMHQPNTQPLNFPISLFRNLLAKRNVVTSGLKSEG